MHRRHALRDEGFEFEAQRVGVGGVGRSGMRLAGMLSVVSEPQAEPVTSESLARERCVELPAGTPPLTTEDVRSLAGAIAREWQVNDAEIRRDFSFKSFNAAFGLATRIALLAESQNHHPELEVAWGRLVVRLTTHSVGGLSRNDFIMAARIDRLAGG
jgi:4a-hydroxytetrahydrobiopterin dehydratase